jgi:hypothetical protein
LNPEESTLGENLTLKDKDKEEVNVFLTFKSFSKN